MERKNEQERDSWEAFFHTGKVEDYLRYASCKEGGNLNDSSVVSGYAGVGNVFCETTESVGDRPYAGYYSSNRNYIETEPYRGIR